MAPKTIKRNITLPEKQIADFCRRHHISKLSLFGSALSEDFSERSDIDLLVEFEPGYRVGLIRLAGMEIELSQLLGRKVDLRTPADLSQYFRHKVIQSAEVQYDAQRG